MWGAPGRESLSVQCSLGPRLARFVSVCADCVVRRRACVERAKGLTCVRAGHASCALCADTALCCRALSARLGRRTEEFELMYAYGEMGSNRGGRVGRCARLESTCSHYEDEALRQRPVSRVAAGQHMHNVLSARWISLSPADTSERAVSQMPRRRPLLSGHTRRAQSPKHLGGSCFGMHPRSILTFWPRLAWNLQYAGCCDDLAATGNMPR